jgi:hypothetical protein
MYMTIYGTAPSVFVDDAGGRVWLLIYVIDRAFGEALKRF